MDLARRILLTALVAVVAFCLAMATAWLVGKATSDVAAPRVDERVRGVETAAVAVGGWLDDVRALAVPASLDGPVWAYAVDASGTVVATSPAAGGLLGLPRQPPPAGLAVVTDPFDRVPMVQASAATDATTTVVGVPLDGLLRLLTRLPEPPGAQLSLVDPAGTLLRRGPPPGTLARASSDVAEPVRLAGAGAGFVEYVGEGGIETSAAYAPAGHGWTLILAEEAAAFTPRGAGLRAVAAAIPGLSGFVVLVVVGFAALDARARRLRREAERTKHAFLAVAGHELRTPLTVVSGMLGVLARGGEMGADTRVQAARAAARQTKQLERLIERLLFVAHLESGIGVGVSPVATNLAPLLERSVDTQRGLSPVHELSLETDTPLWARADARAVEQILLHLLDNAARYSPAGSTITVTGRSGRRRVTIAVQDEGVGLPADPSRIFELFVQGESVDARLHDEGGVGLGLAIVRTLTQAMDGTVRAEHAPVGARFVVELPTLRARD